MQILQIKIFVYSLPSYFPSLAEFCSEAAALGEDAASEPSEGLDALCSFTFAKGAPADGLSTVLITNFWPLSVFSILNNSG